MRLWCVIAGVVSAGANTLAQAQPSPTYVPLTPEEDRRQRGIPEAPPEPKQEPPPEYSRVLVKIAASFVFASTEENRKPMFNISCCRGPSITTAIGYRVFDRLALGLEATLGRLTGSYNFMGGLDYAMLLVPVDVGVLAELYLHPRLWLTANVGVHYDYLTEPTLIMGAPDPIEWHGAIGAGFGLRIELVRRGPHTLSALTTIQGAFATYSDYGAVNVGLGYVRATSPER